MQRLRVTGTVPAPRGCRRLLRALHMVAGLLPLPLHAQSAGQGSWYRRAHRTKCRSESRPRESQLLKEQTPEGERPQSQSSRPNLEARLGQAFAPGAELLHLPPLREPSVTLPTGHTCNHSVIHAPTCYVFITHLLTSFPPFSIDCFFNRNKTWQTFSQEVVETDDAARGGRSPCVPSGLGLTKTSALLEVPYQLLTLSIC